jgi:hypothetical protein
MEWKARRFSEVIDDDCGITVTLPLTNEGYYEVNSEIKIWPVQFSAEPSYNPKIEYLHGPFYEYTDGVAYSSMVVQQLPLDAAQNFVKQDAATARWKKQNSGVKVTLNGTEYTFPSDLNTKSIFHQYITSNLDSVNWKVNQDTWITLSKTDMQTVFNAIISHVQSTYDWEATKLTEIVAATHETLPNITLE